MGELNQENGVPPPAPPWMPAVEKETNQIIAGYNEDFKPSIFQKLNNQVRNKKIQITTAIFTMIFLLAAGVFGVYYYQNQVKKMGAEEIPSLSSPQITPTSKLTFHSPTPTPKETPTPSPSPVTPTPSPSPPPSVQRTGVHFYEDSSRPIDNISVNVVYFVPQGLQADSSWSDGIRINIEAVKSFYERELGGKSKISFTIHSEAIYSSHGYNLSVPNTEPGYSNICRDALNSAIAEIKNKVTLRSDGDLNLWAIVFEGLNCGIAPPGQLVVPGYAIDQVYETRSADIASPVGKLIGHEFGHLLGIPDLFESEEIYMHNNQREPYCSAMSHCQGDGKSHSLDELFLCDRTKQKLGVF